jgi:hypothetical protein
MDQNGKTNERNIALGILRLSFDPFRVLMRRKQLHQVQSFRYILHILFIKFGHIIDAQLSFQVIISNTSYLLGSIKRF